MNGRYSIHLNISVVRYFTESDELILDNANLMKPTTYSSYSNSRWFEATLCQLS
jgi:hypothetical protein